MRLAILAILMTAALLAGAVECAASCAAVTVESPCHHHQGAPHHQDPAACSHELVLDRVHAPAIAHGFEAWGAMQTMLPNGRGSDTCWSRLVPTQSCHRSHAGAPLSLRI
jgi:hypothetical protein